MARLGACHHEPRMRAGWQGLLERPGLYVLAINSAGTSQVDLMTREPHPDAKPMGAFKHRRSVGTKAKPGNQLPDLFDSVCRDRISDRVGDRLGFLNAERWLRGSSIQKPTYLRLVINGLAAELLPSAPVPLMVTVRDFPSADTVILPFQPTFPSFIAVMSLVRSFTTL